MQNWWNVWANTILPCHQWKVSCKTFSCATIMTETTRSRQKMPLSLTPTTSASHKYCRSSILTWRAKMKQDLSANSGASETSGTSDQQTQPVRPPKSAKNLYEPYITPPILYEAIHWLAIFVFHVTSLLRLRGLSNLSK